MAIAFVDRQNRVTDTRETLNMGDVPIHKRQGWRPLVGDPPVINGRTQMLVGPTLTVEASRVLRTWEVRDLPEDAPVRVAVEPAAAPQVVIQEADTSLLEGQLALLAQKTALLEAQLGSLANEALKQP